MDDVIKILRCVCFYCSRLLLDMVSHKGGGAWGKGGGGYGCTCTMNSSSNSGGGSGGTLDKAAPYPWESSLRTGLFVP